MRPPAQDAEWSVGAWEDFFDHALSELEKAVFLRGKTGEAF